MKKPFNAIVAASALLICACTCGKPDNGEETYIPGILDAPANVSVTEIGSNFLAFRWDAVEGAQSYTYKLLEGMTLVKNVNTDKTEAVIEDLKEGTAYRFAVKAVNGEVSSKYSDYAEASTIKKNGGQPGEEVLPEPIEDLYSQMRIPAYEEDSQARAFPGAEGGGMYTSGGRGGKVLHVTSLDDSEAEGTLRWAVKQKYARTIVFDVAGIIRLKSPLKIEYGDCTIAGQTAPGDGICIADRYVNIASDNVIIRFVRFRLGDQGNGAGDSDDAIWGRYCNNIMIDHCSMSWSIDECASFYSNSNFTMQWCIMAESMKNCSIHTKGSHGYGGIWGGENASFHHNILAHHDSRNPRFDHPHIYQDHTTPAHRGVIDYRNNVVYDWGSNSSYGGEGYGSGKGIGINMIANMYKPGPSSADKKYFMDSYAVYASCSSCGKNIDEGYALLHMDGNVHTKYTDISSDNASGIYWHNGEGHANYAQTAAQPFPVVGLDGKSCMTTTHSAAEALDAVCAYAGASLSRDKVDIRIASDVKNGTGRIIDDIADLESAYGFSWPAYKATEEDLTKRVDTDMDGIPDWYESLFGLDPENASDAAATTIDKNGRYSNFEMYLHYLVRNIMAEENDGGRYAGI